MKAFLAFLIAAVLFLALVRLADSARAWLSRDCPQVCTPDEPVCRLAMCHVDHVLGE